MITLPIWLLIIIGLFGLPLLVILLTAFYCYIRIIIIIVKEVFMALYG